MKIYNHLLNKKESLETKTLNIYVCGPTVYNHVHLGNIRPIIAFDVLNRTLKELGCEVNFVHNITDIDDKIIKKAKEENKSELDISSFYTDKYFDILDKLNIDKSNISFPKVSENIENIIEYIELLVNKGFAYFIDGDVYFRTSKIKDYGKVSGMQIDELEDGSRIDQNNKKENVKDFTLWKKTDVGLNWETKYSKGRPGWHTECAVLINKYFKQQADIHGGGVDLKFPHHENENAQNIAINNKPIAKLWMHVGHLNIDNTKMSKSLNNFVLAKDLLEKFNSNTIRWFFYQTSYSNPINYTYDLLTKLESEVESIINSLNSFKSYCILNNEFNEKLNFDKSFLNPLLDDLNFPNTISFIAEKIKEANLLLRKKEYKQLNNLYFNIKYLLTNILGLQIKDIHSKENIEILLEWNKLKNDKKFDEADKKREILIKQKLI